jgi:hypothetical protein
MADATDTNGVSAEVAEPIADLPSSSDEIVAHIVMLSGILHTLLTQKRPPKALMATELGILTEHLMSRHPEMFPGSTKAGG